MSSKNLKKKKKKKQKTKEFFQVNGTFIPLARPTPQLQNTKKRGFFFFFFGCVCVRVGWGKGGGRR
jgi:hypothetical protein